MPPSATEDTAGVVLPPPVIYLGGLLPGLLADRLLALPALPGLAGRGGLYLGAALGLLGLALVLIAAGRFFRAGTAIQPHQPASALVTGGLYRLSRNPIYLGITLLYLGLVAGFASLGALALLPVVLLAMEFGVIRREERYLERRFGQAYRDYRARVRRWI
ncbi:MAG: methyltransferase family protein [Kiloniellaceae bacterium]